MSSAVGGCEDGQELQRKSAEGGAKRIRSEQIHGTYMEKLWKISGTDGKSMEHGNIFSRIRRTGGISNHQTAFCAAIWWSSGDGEKTCVFWKQEGNLYKYFIDFTPLKNLVDFRFEKIFWFTVPFQINPCQNEGSQNNCWFCINLPIIYTEIRDVWDESPYQPKHNGEVLMRPLLKKNTASSNMDQMGWLAEPRSKTHARDLII